MIVDSKPFSTLSFSDTERHMNVHEGGILEGP